MKLSTIVVGGATLLLLAAAKPVSGQTPVGTAVTYQGYLRDHGAPANGLYDFRFILFDDEIGGSQVGDIILQEDIPASSGYFAALLDFGSEAFRGDARWLELSVRPGATTGPYWVLSPRQALTPTPYSVFGLDTQKIGGQPVDTSSPLLGDVLKWDGLMWSPGVEEGPAYTAGPGLSLAGLEFSLDKPTTDAWYWEEAQTVGGDAAGLLSSLTVTKLQGRSVSAAAPANQQVLKWNGASWSPTSDNDTTYAAGTGITLAGTQFSLNTSYADSRYVNEDQTSSISNTMLQTSSVTTPKISSSGATTGRAIMYDGSSVTWGYPRAGSLQLPMQATASASGNALEIFNSGTGTAIYAEGGSSGNGVVGMSGSSGVRYGVYGGADGTSGRGVGGFAVAATGAAYGGYFETESSGGHAVYAHSDATSGQSCGVLANTNSPAGFGVWGGSNQVGVLGFHGAVSAFWGNSGVAGSSLTGNGVAALSDSGTGVYATCGTGAGVYGSSTSGHGVYGNSTGGANMCGVHGYNTNAAGWGVYATGRSGASGTKSFHIDHPLDPANKYLDHYSAEGPEPLNVYCGTAILGADGTAVVELPTYFQAINRDFRYQLTPIGAAMPNLHVAEEIVGNRFTIAGGAVGKKVSWEVKGVRNDPYVQTYGAPVVQEKPAEQKGKYLHPELYNQPQEKGLHYLWSAPLGEAVMSEPVEPAAASVDQGDVR